jgi:hypothetical protein
MELKGSLIAFVACLAVASLGPLGHAQTRPSPAGPTQRSLADFIRGAHNSASFQLRAAQIAAAREARAEAKNLAEEAARLRREHLREIEAFAKERRLILGRALTFEQKSILANLEPLDFLALSRRYLELQMQALEQEIGAYEEAAMSAEPAMKEFALQWLSRLKTLRDSALRVQDGLRR